MGAGGPAVNPLALGTPEALRRLTGEQPWTASAAPFNRPGHVFRSIDASLGVPGLPQSGTGQATLFTGVNCAEVAGRHFGPYPHSRTRPVLASRNVFLQIREIGLNHPEPAAFANAYPPRFFQYAHKTDRWTVTTRACLDADLRIRGVDDVHAGAALTAELTGSAWHEHLGIRVPLLTAEEAGRRLVRIADQHRFTLFEYYLTDKAGHSRSFDRAGEVLAALNGFFSGILAAFDPARNLLIVTSDHGNLEDLSTKSHTTNPVPLITLGRGAGGFGDVEDLTGVTPGIVTSLTP
jgi:2,3-bisphosphoglycerate-independent phosphoglycerate mutase